MQQAPESKIQSKVLALKYRPTNFQEVIGQEHILRVLKHALDSGDTHHAYLFSGTRGVGKTTLARIFAKSLNCEQGVSATPCDQCNACMSFKLGAYVDLIEVDAASRTKVEDTRELLENVSYAPIEGRYKVYLIDEVHMLSTHSFNALLKTLEEPPPHVKFLLATTDPQKLPITVVSRCVHLQLRPLTLYQLEDHLKNLLTTESIDFELNAVKEVALAAEGSVRDALTILEQAIAHGQGQLKFSEVSSLLGITDPFEVVKLLKAIFEGATELAFERLAILMAKSSNADQLIRNMLQVFHDLAKVQALGKRAINREDSDGHGEKILTELAQQASPELIQVGYQALVQSLKDLPYMPNPVLALEMAILRIIYFVPMSQVDLDENVALPSGSSSEVKSDAPMESTEKSSPALQQERVQPTSQHTNGTDAADIELTVEPQMVAEKTIAEKTVTEKKKTSESDIKAWAETLEALEKKGEIRGGVSHILFNCRLSPSEHDSGVKISVSPKDTCMLTDQIKKRVERVIQFHVTDSSRLDWSFEEEVADNIGSARDYIKHRDELRRKMGAAHLEKVDLVQSLLKMFNAELVFESVIVDLSKIQFSDEVTVTT